EHTKPHTTKHTHTHTHTHTRYQNRAQLAGDLQETGERTHTHSHTLSKPCSDAVLRMLVQTFVPFSFSGKKSNRTKPQTAKPHLRVRSVSEHEQTQERVSAVFQSSRDG